VSPIGGNDHVSIEIRFAYDSRRNRFLADAKMHRTDDVTAHAERTYLLLKASDPQHHPQILE
jgi:hypothetical protein